MENASKALIIAGAILLSILIIAIGMYIYTSAQAQVENSLTNMSTSELEGFNSTFTSYQGNQTGSQVKALIQRLVANAKTYDEEIVKIPMVAYCNEGDDAATGASESNVTDNVSQGDIAEYVKTLNFMSNQLELKHTYNVVMETGVSGMIEKVTINYEATNKQGNQAERPWTTTAE